MKPAGFAPPTLGPRLIQLVESELALMRRFIALLEREETLLIAAETDELMALSREKTDLYHLLQQQSDARARLLSQAGLTPDQAGMERVCTALPGLLKSWRGLLETAETARNRNQLNGKLITEHMHRNQAALSILLDAAQRPQFYDAAGSSRPAGGGRHLGSA